MTAHTPASPSTDLPAASGPPSPYTGFGRGWVPGSRDIGLPGDVQAWHEELGTPDPLDCGFDLPTRGIDIDPDDTGGLWRAQIPACDPFGGGAHHNAWTLSRRALFLHTLAEQGNVRLAARRCGMSAQGAYVLRRRDRDFARAWAAALVLAREAAEQVLGERAIYGVAEPVFHRGEVVGRRVRYDTRLLLAHLGRLDVRCDRDARAVADAERFDELVAVVAGEDYPDEMLPYDPGDGTWDPTLPEARERHARYSAQRVAQKRQAAAREAAHARWDEWEDRTRRRVDGLLEDVAGEGAAGESPRGGGDLGPEDGSALTPKAPASAGARGEGEPPIEYKSLNPPRTGEGDRRREAAVVVGACPSRCTQPRAPSTMLRRVHLPVPGRCWTPATV